MMENVVVNVKKLEEGEDIQLLYYHKMTKIWIPLSPCFHLFDFSNSYPPVSFLKDFDCVNYTRDLAQPTFQRRINVVSTLWINVEITLIRRWKWNKIRSRIFNVAQRWYNVGTDVETRLKQRWYNFISALFQRGFNISKSYTKASRACDKYRFVNL